MPGERNLFEELFASVRFEDMGKGRAGTVLVKVDETGGIPLVRTTTRYGAPAQRFQAVHERLAQQIQERAALTVGFNNALVEAYTNAYATMGSHSDQALDLAEQSFIAVYSCYENPDVNPTRKLIVESKEPGGGKVDIPLTHNSAVVFSVDTNRRHKHKIVLDRSSQPAENRWLGVTFRTSKTFVRFRDEQTYFPGGARLTSADDEQRREFYQLRRRENKETDFTYPVLTYTISDSDLMPPV
ncbi:alpha-ketoglutarate-dependent dioxygenase AlkB [Nonomuraea sp. NPDC050404]|uniref:alpha-ketoglutarate-dependent dioxygenase AlkB n=1 Tax=Nonomuraea sp. NPDC050404 TaxID=3155783 RepID=UPI0033E6B3C0